MVNKTGLASAMLSMSGLGTLLRRTSGHRGFIVLNYHRIGDPSKSIYDRDVFSGTVEMFEKQLRFLKAECEVITPDEIKDIPARSRGNYSMITFDDGYRDNYENAFPALKAAGLKAVFFVSTGFIDRPRLSWWDEIAWMVRSSKKSQIGPTTTLPICVPFDDERQPAINQLLSIYKRLPTDITQLYLNDLAEETGSGRAPERLGADVWMTWDMLREMRDAGMYIGGHTVNHPILATMSRFDQELEILGCAGALEQNLGEPMRIFSYPRGKPDAFNEDTRACLYEAQVQYAFSYYGGLNHGERLDPYDVRRVAVNKDTQMEHFEAMVSCPWIFA